MAQKTYNAFIVANNEFKTANEAVKKIQNEDEKAAYKAEVDYVNLEKKRTRS
ncbi:MAG: hypothetical protein R2867_15955 [Caldilineaceae bacterium]